MSRRRRRASLRSMAFAHLVVTVLALAAVQIVLYVDALVDPLWAFIAFTGVGVDFVLVGVLTWRRRPSNHTGALLCWCGLALLAAAFGNTAVPALVGIGLITAQLSIAVLLHLLLAFPSGRLHSTVPRLVVWSAYIGTIGMHAPSYLFSGDPDIPGWLRIADRPQVVSTVSDLENAAGFVIIVIASVVLVRRLRTAASAQRRAVAFVWGYGVFTIVFLTVSANVATVVGIDPIMRFAAQLAVVAGVPVAFGFTILRGGFARTGELEELGAWLGSGERNRASVRDALSDTLGDPSLDVLFWLPDAATYVDASGREAEPHALQRGYVEIDTGGTRIGAIVYDPTLIDDAALVRAAGRIIALGVDRERLTVALRASEAALRASRARVVTSADTERRRVAADLHDGVQGRLVVQALRAGQLATDPQADPAVRAQATELRTGLETTIAELRRLVHGMIPALLIQRGLPAAIEELVDQTPIRCHLLITGATGVMPTTVESTAYFVIAEALANAVKHSQAQELSVRVERDTGRLRIEVGDDGVGGARIGAGAGLRGIGDRVDALGGHLHIDSRPDIGTRLIAELPCES